MTKAGRSGSKSADDGCRVVIRNLEDEDAQACTDLRRDALLDSPLAFASSPEDDILSSPEAVREQLRGAPATVIIGAFQARIVGMVGLYRERHAKASHKVHLWGMYVAPAHRRQGIAARLLEAALQHARSLGGVDQIQLSVSSAAPAARCLYEAAGFQVWGTEPEALRHEGRAVAEYHMALDLSSN